MTYDGPRITVYPTEKQKERWGARADDLDMGMSEFVKSMTEAGLKKFDATIEPTETLAELREQRNDLRDELDRTRERVAELEDQLHHGERAAIRQYVEENPGATYDEIVRHVIDTVPARVSQHLDDMEGEDLVVDPEADTYFPADGAGEETAEG
jgi:predicted nuclease with TOPRIM domain